LTLDAAATMKEPQLRVPSLLVLLVRYLHSFRLHQTCTIIAASSAQTQSPEVLVEEAETTASMQLGQLRKKHQRQYQEPTQVH
jgi:hypothetical protein